MPFSISVELRGTTELMFTINGLRTMDFTKYHQDAAEYMKRSVQENYRSKTAPDGSTWSPHGDRYPQWLAERGGSLGDVLRLTGKMYSSVVAEGNAQRGKVSYASQGYGDRLHGAGITTDKLAFFHTIGAHTPAFPWRGLPKRPQMGFSRNRADVSELTAMLSRFINAKLAASRPRGAQLVRGGFVAGP